MLNRKADQRAYSGDVVIVHHCPRRERHHPGGEILGPWKRRRRRLVGLMPMTAGVEVASGKDILRLQDRHEIVAQPGGDL